MDHLLRYWWMMTARGVLALAFGAAVLTWPGLDLGALVVVFGCYAVVDGAWALAAALRASARSLDAWPVGLEGIVSVLLGALAVTSPFMPAATIRLIAVWGLATGVLELVAAWQISRQSAGHWLLGTGGVSSLFLAAFLIALPHAGRVPVARALGVYASVFGVIVLAATLRFRATLRGVAHPMGGPVTIRSSLP